MKRPITHRHMVRSLTKLSTSPAPPTRSTETTKALPFPPTTQEAPRWVG